ncbi:MAG: type III pantothenate kinase [Oscillospiraceae bacterium]|nr:type III pantothenate kinase [Oscillospiraceae bacterium]
MILAIDIGNTNIVLGGFSGDDLSFVARIATNPSKTEDEYATKIKSILELHNADRENIDGAIISSVVPPLNSVMKKAINIAYGVDSIMVGPGIKTGINIHCDNPSSVGADLICACVAAHHIYGSPSLVIDMGTATKMMVINEKGTFIGVSIIPGVSIALSALASGTAQLPQISLEAPKSVIGKNTIDCMRSGVVFGNASMIDGMIDRFFEEMGKEFQVIATGGLAPTIIRHCKHNITLDSDLIMKGLNILYKKNK